MNRIFLVDKNPTEISKNIFSGCLCMKRDQITSASTDKNINMIPLQLKPKNQFEYMFNFFFNIGF